jgi:uncharacterized phage protein (TIGR01671 family)
MRQIKFRGKRIVGSDWVFGGYAKRFDEHYIFEEFGASYEVNPETVGQWTGGADESHNLIFEGDIVNHTFVNYNLESITVYAFVKWNRWNWSLFTLKDGQHSFHKPLDNPIRINCTLVGNIYDNPELLKEFQS